MDADRARAEFRAADHNNDRKLELKEVTDLLFRLNIKKSSKEVKERFRKFDHDNSKSLDEWEFTKFFLSLQERDDIDKVFLEHFSKDKTAAALLRFMQDVQKEPEATLETAKEIIDRYETGKELTSIGFTAWISDTKRNSAMSPAAAKLYQPMDQPLHHYYISSSHNTYLLEDQLRGPSSTTAYQNALIRGCRCVELDCWDDPSGPIIYHGFTLTSKITFKDVLLTIKEYAFKTSDYPVILSLEVHCGVTGQKQMAELLLEILGKEMLAPADRKAVALKSPEQLKKKILLKGKSKPFVEEGAEIPEKLLKEAKQDKTPAVPIDKISKELSDLIGLKATGFTNWDASGKFKPHYMSSFSEDKIDSFARKNINEFIDYNRKQLSRIFPKGGRVDSSNYDPVKSWNHGASIVALNFQTASEPMFLNDGKFCENGGSGYVLKPNYFRVTDSLFHPGEKGGFNTTFTITIISAFQLPKSITTKHNRSGEIIDPYVKFKVRGISHDDYKDKTKVVNSNGWNPIWDRQCKFTVSRPELALILFCVYDKDLLTKDDLIGHWSQPLSCLREGYRSVPLRGRNGEILKHASIFLKIQMFAH